MKRKMKNSEKSPKDKILSKFTTGRTKSFKKRKNTLLYEYKYRNKTNRFIDRRIGEKNRAMTIEDRLMARFAAERIKRHKRKEMYNLGDDEDVVLTHSGRALQDVEKFEDPRSDDDDEDDNVPNNGKLQADYVSEAHFGGGLFSKIDRNTSSHHNIIDDLISESKKRKVERQLIRERTSFLTDKLDKDFNQLLPFMSDRKDDENRNIISSDTKTNSYDVNVNKLKFEAVTKPSDRTKSELEIEIEENRKLKQLEAERINRMKRPADDFNNTQPEEEEEIPLKRKHKSADDLNDGFDLTSDTDTDDDSESDHGDSEDNSPDDDEDESIGSETEEVKKQLYASNDDYDANRDSKISAFNEKCDNIAPNKTDKNQRKNEDFEMFKTMLHGKSLTDKVAVIKNIIKERHPSSGGSKQRLMVIFPFILDYFDHLASVSIKDCWLLAENVYPILFDLTQISPDDAGSHVFTKLEEKQRIFNEQENAVIADDVLPILKLVPLLFPTSDYYHPVITPTIQFICQMLCRSSVNSVADVIKGVFCTTLLLEFVDLSQKYCPEAVNYLQKLLRCATNRKYKEDNWRHREKLSDVLVVSNSFKCEEMSAEDLKLTVDDLNCRNYTDMSKVKILHAVLRLSAQFLKYYSEFSASYIIWTPFLTTINQLPVNNYPTLVKLQIESLGVAIEKLSNRKLCKLMAAKKRPKLLRQYEPNIRPVIDGKSFRIISEEKRERNKLMSRYKKEMRGAIKEIRKDRSFIAGVKFAEQAKQDAERQAKVKQIYSWGQSQQSELKKLERKMRR